MGAAAGGVVRALVVLNRQADAPRIDHDFAGMGKIHRHAGADHRLDLADAPIGLGRVQNPGAGYEFRMVQHSGML